MSTAKKIIYYVICTIALAVILVLAIRTANTARNYMNHRNVIRNMEQGNYQVANQYITKNFREGLFGVWKRYWDSDVQLYVYAHLAIEELDYTEAFALLEVLRDYRDSQQIRERILPLAYENAVSRYYNILQMVSTADAIEDYANSMETYRDILRVQFKIRQGMAVFTELENYRDSNEYLRKSEDLLVQLGAIRPQGNNRVNQQSEPGMVQQAEEPTPHTEQEFSETLIQSLIGTWEYLGDPPIFQEIDGVRYHPTNLGNQISFFGNGAFQATELGITLTAAYAFEDNYLVITAGAGTMAETKSRYAIEMSRNEITLRCVDNVQDFAAPRGLTEPVPYMNFLPITYTRQ